jgi:gliding motility-associated-like protein
VFTPNNDFVNDAYDIDAVGIIKYRLDIFNRWGEKVYVSERDGFGNDGINWNGRVRNDGRECPEGTYFFVFNYQLANMLEAKEVHGTITLIRDK